MVRVVRCETKTPVTMNDPDEKLVLGRKSLRLSDNVNLKLTGSGTQALGDTFLVDFWLNAKELRETDGDVTIFGTANDALKVTLSNNISETSTTLQSETGVIQIM